MASFLQTISSPDELAALERARLAAGRNRVIFEDFTSTRKADNIFAELLPPINVNISLSLLLSALGDTKAPGLLVAAPQS